MRRALLVFLSLGLLLAAMSLRVIVAGEQAIAQSTQALRDRDPHAAALYARRAAGWYAPGAPHVRVAYQRLITLATVAEGRGDAETALFAWRAVRTAALETRWLITPHQGDLLTANQAIARLAANAPRPPGTRTEPTSTIEQQQLQALIRDESPQRGWILALLVAFSAWITGGIWLVKRAVTTTGQWVFRSTLQPILLSLSGVLLWLLSLWRA